MEHDGITGEPRRSAGPEPWPVPPWELPGGFRRDCEPHRADLLRRLGYAALMCLGATVLGPGCVPRQVPMAGVVQVALLGAFWLLQAALGLAAWLLARRDLAEMAAGRMDPRGREDTKQAKAHGLAAFAIAAIWALVIPVAAVLLYALSGRS